MGILEASQSASQNSSSASSWSNTAGVAASQMAASAASSANSSAMAAWREAAEFNAEQARIQREWQERMANTVYQRSTEDMKKAGINPILAAQMGLGTASVGSGATASMASPNTYMANTFPESNSASSAESSGWSQSTSGFMTALTQIMAGMSQALSGLSSGLTVNMNMDNLLKDSYKEETHKGSDGRYQGTFSGKATNITDLIKEKLGIKKGRLSR